MSASPSGADPGVQLMQLFDDALPEVYGYLLHRCGDVAVAEELAAECFLAAVAAAYKPQPPTLSVAWLIGVARHKLVDHWRGQERERRVLHRASEHPREEHDPWDEQIDAWRARETLAQLRPQHRAALTLRYVDGLPVRQVADHLGRTLHATEALLVRARHEFRQAYGEREGGR